MKAKTGMPTSGGRGDGSGNTSKIPDQTRGRCGFSGYAVCSPDCRHWRDEYDCGVAAWRHEDGKTGACASY